MRRENEHRAADERYRGQSIVEFAVAVVILLSLFVLAIDVGRAMSAYEVISSMAEAGAYYGAINPTDTSGISSAALNELGGSGKLYGYTPTVSSSVANDPYEIPGTSTYYQAVTVTVSYTYHPIFVAFGPMKSGLTMRRQVEMRVAG